MYVGLFKIPCREKLKTQNKVSSAASIKIEIRRGAWAVKLPTHIICSYRTV
jgi:hypothetical protein